MQTHLRSMLETQPPRPRPTARLRTLCWAGPGSCTGKSEALLQNGGRTLYRPRPLATANREGGQETGTAQGTHLHPLLP